MTPKKLNVDVFAADLLAYRIDKKLTRDALLKLIGGGSADIIKNIENDKRRPSLEVAFNLCEVMGKSLNDYMVEKF